VATLDARGIPARAVAIGGAWGMIPAASYGLVALVLATGVAAGVAAVPMLVWTSPLVAALMLGAAGHGIRTPLSSARRPATRLPPGVERRIIGAFVELPPGLAQRLLDATTALGTLRTEAVAQRGAVGTELSELTRELEAEAAARAAAAKEVADLLATG